MGSFGYSSYQDSRLDPEHWTNDAYFGRTRINGQIVEDEVCELCDHESYDGEHADIGWVCRECFDDCKCLSCGDFVAPENTNYINDDEGRLEKYCLTCYEEIENE